MNQGSVDSSFAGMDAAATQPPHVLLVGTAMSVRQLHHCLKAAEPSPEVLGCLISASVAADDLPCPLLGDLDSLADTSGRLNVDQVLVSLPLAMASRIQQLAGQLGRLGVTWRFLPTLGDQLAGRTTSRIAGGFAALTDDKTAAPPLFSGHAPIDPAALIDRKPRPLQEAVIRQCLAGKTVMITGSGGSIGSELARVVSRFRPAKLLLVERSENALFEIDREIARVFPDMARKAIMHDVTHREGTFDLVRQYRPHVIFHAAAHKHVPMMEDHPAHAVENNFFGTRAIADAADAFGVERFVMISTDKAVNPSSVMGASKRLAELYIQQLNTRSQTVFAMVRFGNVLGSACSVLTIWAKQLTHGGPVTVTHPEMSRYFMTIPEAAGLVLQAGALSKGGEVFLLDMGQPVRIVDLAQRFVRAQGLEPGVDVEIAFTGIRPGEKLFELLAYEGEDMIPTPHASVRIWQTTPPSQARIDQIVTLFDRLRHHNGDVSHPWRGTSRQAIVDALRSAIPEMVHAAAG